MPTLRQAQFRHAIYYFEVIRKVCAHYEDGGQQLVLGLELFDLEWANLRRAQAWSEKYANEDFAAALFCSFCPDALSKFLYLRQHPHERIRWLVAALAVSRRLGDHVREGHHLNNLGVAYASLGEFNQADEFFKESLAVSGAVGVSEEGMALGNLGVNYADLGEPRRGIEYLERQLAKTREAKDRQGEGNALGNLGTAYADLREHRRAAEFFQQHLAVAREIADRIGEGTALGNLGAAYANLGDHHRAIEMFDQQSKITQEVGDKRGEGYSLFNKSLVFNTLGDRAQAIAHAEKSLRIFEELEAPIVTELREKLSQWHEQARTIKQRALVSTPHPDADPERAYQLNLQYQRELARWKALPWLKRLTTRKPEPPRGV